MHRLLIASLLCLFNLATLLACSCGGYIDSFCYSADSTDYIALVELIDFEDQTAAQFRIIENLNKETPDTIYILGQDGLNCNLTLYQFEIGDTLILNLDYYEGGVENAENRKIYNWGVEDCTRQYLQYSKGLVSGAIDTTIDQSSYIDFKENFDYCLDFTLSSAEIYIPNIKIFPNPSNHLLNISIPENISAKISLSDANGNCRKPQIEYPGDGFTFDLSDLSTGIYFITFETQKGILTRRILKI